MNLTPVLSNIFKKYIPSPKPTPSQFSEWLSGFIDAEGNFQVYFDRNYLRAKFRISLHIDDKEVLYEIQKRLGVGNVRESRTSCLFEVNNITDISSVLLPITLFFIKKRRKTSFTYN